MTPPRSDQLLPINGRDGVKIVDLSGLRGGARPTVRQQSGAGGGVTALALPGHPQLAQQLPRVEVDTVHLVSQ